MIGNIIYQICNICKYANMVYYKSLKMELADEPPNMRFLHGRPSHVSGGTFKALVPNATAEICERSAPALVAK